MQSASDVLVSRYLEGKQLPELPLLRGTDFASWQQNGGRFFWESKTHHLDGMKRFSWPEWSKLVADTAEQKRKAPRELHTWERDDASLLYTRGPKYTPPDELQWYVDTRESKLTLLFGATHAAATPRGTYSNELRGAHFVHDQYLMAPINAAKELGLLGDSAADWRSALRYQRLPMSQKKATVGDPRLDDVPKHDAHHAGSRVYLRSFAVEILWAEMQSGWLDGERVCVAFAVPDRDNPARRITLYYNHNCPPAGPLDGAQRQVWVAEQVRQATLGVFSHEVDEMLYMGAVRYREPHPERQSEEGHYKLGSPLQVLV